MADMTLQEAYNHAKQAAEAGEGDRAIALGQHLLRYYPRYVEGYRLLGEAYLERGQLHEAGRLFSHVLSCDPQNVLAHIGRAIIADEARQVEVAISELERGFEVDPSIGEVRAELLRLYREHYGSAGAFIRTTPVGLAYTHLRSGLLEQAIAEFSRLSDAGLDRWDIDVALLEALWRNEQLVDAAHLAESILAAHPNCVKANWIVGYLHWTGGKIATGREYLTTAVALDPDYGLARKLWANTPWPLNRAVTTEQPAPLPHWTGSALAVADLDAALAVPLGDEPLAVPTPRRASTAELQPIAEPAEVISAAPTAQPDEEIEPEAEQGAGMEDKEQHPLALMGSTDGAAEDDIGALLAGEPSATAAPPMPVLVETVPVLAEATPVHTPPDVASAPAVPALGDWFAQWATSAVASPPPAAEGHKESVPADDAPDQAAPLEPVDWTAVWTEADSADPAGAVVAPFTPEAVWTEADSADPAGAVVAPSTPEPEQAADEATNNPLPTDTNQADPAGAVMAEYEPEPAADEITSNPLLTEADQADPAGAVMAEDAPEPEQAEMAEDVPEPEQAGMAEDAPESEQGADEATSNPLLITEGDFPLDAGFTASETSRPPLVALESEAAPLPPDGPLLPVEPLESAATTSADVPYITKTALEPIPINKEEASGLFATHDAESLPALPQVADAEPPPVADNPSDRDPATLAVPALLAGHDLVPPVEAHAASAHKEDHMAPSYPDDDDDQRQFEYDWEREGLPDYLKPFLGNEASAAPVPPAPPGGPGAYGTPAPPSGMSSAPPGGNLDNEALPDWLRTSPAPSAPPPAPTPPAMGMGNLDNEALPDWLRAGPAPSTPPAAPAPPAMDMGNFDNAGLPDWLQTGNMGGTPAPAPPPMDMGNLDNAGLPDWLQTGSMGGTPAPAPPPMDMGNLDNAGLPDWLQTGNMGGTAAPAPDMSFAGGNDLDREGLPSWLQSAPPPAPAPTPQMPPGRGGQMADFGQTGQAGGVQPFDFGQMNDSGNVQPFNFGQMDDSAGVQTFNFGPMGDSAGGVQPSDFGQMNDNAGVQPFNFGQAGSGGDVAPFNFSPSPPPPDVQPFDFGQLGGNMGAMNTPDFGQTASPSASPAQPFDFGQLGSDMGNAQPFNFDPNAGDMGNAQPFSFGQSGGGTASPQPFSFDPNAGGMGSPQPFSFDQSAGDMGTVQPFDFGQTGSGMGTAQPFDFGQMGGDMGTAQPFNFDQSGGDTGSVQPFDFGQMGGDMGTAQPFNFGQAAGDTGSVQPFDFGQMGGDMGTVQPFNMGASVAPAQPANAAADFGRTGLPQMAGGAAPVDDMDDFIDFLSADEDDMGAGSVADFGGIAPFDMGAMGAMGGAQGFPTAASPPPTTAQPFSPEEFDFQPFAFGQTGAGGTSPGLMGSDLPGMDDLPGLQPFSFEDLNLGDLGGTAGMVDSYGRRAGDRSESDESDSPGYSWQRPAPTPRREPPAEEVLDPNESIFAKARRRKEELEAALATQEATPVPAEPALASTRAVEDVDLTLDEWPTFDEEETAHPLALPDDIASPVPAMPQPWDPTLAAGSGTPASDTAFDFSLFDAPSNEATAGGAELDLDTLQPFDFGLVDVPTEAQPFDFSSLDVSVAPPQPAPAPFDQGYTDLATSGTTPPTSLDLTPGQPEQLWSVPVTPPPSAAAPDLSSLGSDEAGGEFDFSGLPQFDFSALGLSDEEQAYLLAEQSMGAETAPTMPVAETAPAMPEAVPFGDSLPPWLSGGATAVPATPSGAESFDFGAFELTSPAPVPAESFDFGAFDLTSPASAPVDPVSPFPAAPPAPLEAEMFGGDDTLAWPAPAAPTAGLPAMLEPTYEVASPVLAEPALPEIRYSPEPPPAIIYSPAPPPDAAPAEILYSPAPAEVRYSPDLAAEPRYRPEPSPVFAGAVTTAGRLGDAQLTNHESLDDLLRYLDSNPDDAATRLVVADIYSEREDYRRAVEQYRLLTTKRGEVSPNLLEIVIGNLRDLVVQAPDDPQVHRALGDVYRKAGMYQAAKAQYEWLLSSGSK